MMGPREGSREGGIVTQAQFLPSVWCLCWGTAPHFTDEDTEDQGAGAPGLVWGGRSRRARASGRGEKVKFVLEGPADSV